MNARERHIAYLKGLPREECERQVRRELSDSLQELVAAIEHAAAARGHTFRSCVVDDFQIVRTDFGEHVCLVVLRYSGEARRNDPGHKDRERISGNAEAAIDDAGKVTYKGVTFSEEQTFVGPDVGVGD